VAIVLYFGGAHLVRRACARPDISRSPGLFAALAVTNELPGAVAFASC